MATSSQVIDTSLIVTLENLTVNSVADLNNMISEIVTKFNATLETTSGHNHDAVTSRFISVGNSAITSQDLLTMLIGGGIS